MATITTMEVLRIYSTFKQKKNCQRYKIHTIQSLQSSKKMACASTNQIVQRLLVLASDPDNIKFIVEQSGCLTGLTSYLVDNDIEVVKKAVETISLLASNKDARKYLAEHEGLVENLTTLLS